MQPRKSSKKKDKTNNVNDEKPEKNGIQKKIEAIRKLQRKEIQEIKNLEMRLKKRKPKKLRRP